MKGWKEDERRVRRRNVREGKEGFWKRRGSREGAGGRGKGIQEGKGK